MQRTQPTATKIPSHIYIARISIMVLVNGTSRQSGYRGPFSARQVNALRTQLLPDPFFDRGHRPEELAPQIRPNPVHYHEIVLLLARLQRVLSRPGPLTREETAERVAARNEALNQPFFDRAQPQTDSPFTGISAEHEDEGFFEQGV